MYYCGQLPNYLKNNFMEPLIAKAEETTFSSQSFLHSCHTTKPYKKNRGSH